MRQLRAKRERRENNFQSAQASKGGWHRCSGMRIYATIVRLDA